MKILFVHGMGATRFDAFPTLARLKRLGYDTFTFSYSSTFQTLEAIKTRLKHVVAELAVRDDYALIGRSLGGVLLRDILMDLPAGVRPPVHLFLVGSPILATQMNSYLNRFGFTRATRCFQRAPS